MSISFQP